MCAFASLGWRPVSGERCGGQLRSTGHELDCRHHPHRRRRVLLRTLSVADLVSAALAVDEDTRPEYTSFLHLRGDRETFDAARSLCGDAGPARRELGAYILGQLGAVTLSAEGEAVVVRLDERPFRAPAVTLLL